METAASSSEDHQRIVDERKAKFDRFKKFHRAKSYNSLEQKRSFLRQELASLRKIMKGEEDDMPRETEEEDAAHPRRRSSEETESNSPTVERFMKEMDELIEKGSHKASEKSEEQHLRDRLLLSVKGRSLHRAKEKLSYEDGMMLEKALGEVERLIEQRISKDDDVNKRKMREELLETGSSTTSSVAASSLVETVSLSLPVVELQVEEGIGCFEPRTTVERSLIHLLEPIHLQLKTFTVVPSSSSESGEEEVLVLTPEPPITRDQVSQWTREMEREGNKYRSKQRALRWGMVRVCVNQFWNFAVAVSSSTQEEAEEAGEGAAPTFRQRFNRLRYVLPQHSAQFQVLPSGMMEAAVILSRVPGAFPEGTVKNLAHTADTDAPLIAAMEALSAGGTPRLRLQLPTNQFSSIELEHAISLLSYTDNHADQFCLQLPFIGNFDLAAFSVSRIGESAVPTCAEDERHEVSNTIDTDEEVGAHIKHPNAILLTPKVSLDALRSALLLLPKHTRRRQEKEGDNHQEVEEEQRAPPPPLAPMSSPPRVARITVGNYWQFIVALEDGEEDGAPQQGQQGHHQQQKQTEGKKTHTTVMQRLREHHKPSYAAYMITAADAATAVRFFDTMLPTVESKGFSRIDYSISIPPQFRSDKNDLFSEMKSASYKNHRKILAQGSNKSLDLVRLPSRFPKKTLFDRILDPSQQAHIFRVAGSDREFVGLSIYQQKPFLRLSNEFGVTVADTLQVVSPAAISLTSAAFCSAAGSRELAFAPDALRLELYEKFLKAGITDLSTFRCYADVDALVSKGIPEDVVQRLKHPNGEHEGHPAFSPLRLFLGKRIGVNRDITPLDRATVLFDQMLYERCRKKNRDVLLPAATEPPHRARVGLAANVANSNSNKRKKPNNSGSPVVNIHSTQISVGLPVPITTLDLSKPPVFTALQAHDYDELFGSFRQRRTVAELMTYDNHLVKFSENGDLLTPPDRWIDGENGMGQMETEEQGETQKSVEEHKGRPLRVLLSIPLFHRARFAGLMIPRKRLVRLITSSVR